SIASNLDRGTDSCSPRPARAGMRPASAQGRTMKKPQVTQVMPLWMLAIAGLGGIVALFYFGYDQDLLIRVTLGLSAAGVASCVPGLFSIKSRTVSATGAIAVFASVFFGDDLVRTVSPASKVPGVSSNVRLSRDQMQYQS